jgi:hypothetical protein
MYGGDAGGFGMNGIQKNMEKVVEDNRRVMSTNLNDFDSLKARADDLVEIAESIKARLEKREMDGESAEMKEI